MSHESRSNAARGSFLAGLAVVGLALIVAFAAYSQAAVPDMDGDQVPDWCDRCLEVPNRSQLDTDQDGLGNVCDCDFNNDGVCTIADFNLLQPDFVSATDSGIGSDMDGDGSVGIGDFNLFLPGFRSAAPGPGASAGRVIDGTCDPASDPTCVDAYRPGACFDARWPSQPLLDQGTAQGCDPIPCSILENHLDPVAFAGVCPGGAGGAVVAGLDFDNPAQWIAQQASLSHPLGNPLDLPLPECPNAAFGSSDLASPGACAARALCEGRCGYGDEDCQLQYVRGLFDTCRSLVGNERAWCKTDCFRFADAFVEMELGPGISRLDAVFDPAIFSGPGLPGEFGGSVESEEALCSCCPDPLFAAGPPPVCGDGSCDAPLESCHIGSCPTDCGSCQLGDACVADQDCGAGSCISGTCRRGGFGAWCDDGADCLSAVCGPNSICQPGSCGDGACDNESCGGCPTDCGLCGLHEACTDPDGSGCLPGLTCHEFTGHALPGNDICLPDCASDSDCGSGEVCDRDACIPIGSLVDGNDCSNSNACSSDLCLIDLLPPISLNSVCADTCLSDAGCTGGSLCDFGACIPPGFKPPGQTCVRNEVCSTGVCNFGLCALPGPAGFPCSTDAACVSGQCAGVCIERCGDAACDGTEVCAGPAQDAEPGVFPGTTSCNADCGLCQAGVGFCDEDVDCESPLFCDTVILGHCVALLPDGNLCTADAQCASGDCRSGFCGGIPNGGPCTSSSLCASGICNIGFCSAGGIGAGGVCTTSLACGSGLVCRSGICQPDLLPNGVPCTTGSQCQSNVCNLAVCTAASSVSVGGACTVSAACGSAKCLAGVCVCQQHSHCSGSKICVSNVCINPPSCQGSGQVCSSGSQCCSGSCTFFTCT